MLTFNGIRCKKSVVNGRQESVLYCYSKFESKDKPLISKRKKQNE